MSIFGRFQIPLPWDVLNVATIENLPGYAPGFVEFAPPEIISPGLSVFTLTQEQLGDLGKLTLRKSGDKMTLVDVSDPPRPNEAEIDPDYLEKQKNAIKINQDEFFRVKEEIEEQINQLYNRRQEHLQKVICAYSSRLVHDLSIWEGNRVIPPPYLLAWAGLDEWPDKNTMSKEGQEYYEKFKQEILAEKNPDLTFIQQKAIATVTSESQKINLKDTTTEGFIAWLQDYCQHTGGYIRTDKGQYVLQGVHILRDGSKGLVEIIFDWIASSGRVYRDAGTIDFEAFQVDATLQVRLPAVLTEIWRGYIDQLRTAIADKWPEAFQSSQGQLIIREQDKQTTQATSIKSSSVKKTIRSVLILLIIIFLLAFLVIIDTFFGILQDIFKHNATPLFETWISRYPVMTLIAFLCLGVIIGLLYVFRDKLSASI